MVFKLILISAILSGCAKFSIILDTFDPDLDRKCLEEGGHVAEDEGGKICIIIKDI